MYHGLAVEGGPCDGFTGPGGAVYSVAPARFGEHLERIAAATAGAPETVDALTGGTARRDAWMITFDDGAASVAGGRGAARPTLLARALLHRHGHGRQPGVPRTGTASARSRAAVT